jgi:hypothetical protein
MRHQTNLVGIDLAVVVFDAKSNRIEELRRFIPIFNERSGEFKPGLYSVLSYDIAQSETTKPPGGRGLVGV